MRLILGADHHGFELKSKLLGLLKAKHPDWELQDAGAHEHNPADDYTDFAVRVSRSVASDTADKGVLLCRSGIGMSIAANKIAGVRASLVANEKEAEMDQLEHHSNVLVFSADKCPTAEAAMQAIEVWHATQPAKGRRLRRVNHIKYLDAQNKIPTPTIIPTILEAEITAATSQFELFTKLMPIVNFDLIDNTLVEGQTISFAEIFEFLQKTPVITSLHLMTKEPLPLLEKLNGLENLTTVYVHAESNLTGVLEPEWSFRLGITFDAPTPIDIELAKKYPIVQLMTVKAGAQGRSFDESALEKIAQLRAEGFQGEIHLDGGINSTTLPQTLPHKPDVLNVGSAITKSPDPKASYRELLNIISDFN